MSTVLAERARIGRSEGRMREIVLDTETTGFIPGDDRMVSIALVEIVDLIPTGEYMHMFLNPEPKESSPGALAVHGLTTEFLSTAPKFGQVASSMRDFLGSSGIVAHNASFDKSFIEAELAAAGYKVPLVNPVTCTLALSRRLPLRRHRLDDMVAHFKIPDLRAMTGGKHGALVDSLLAAQLYFALRHKTLSPAILEATFKIVEEEYGVSISRESPGSASVPSPAEPHPADQAADLRAQRGGDGQDVRGTTAVHHAPKAGHAEPAGAAAGNHPGGGRPAVVMTVDHTRRASAALLAVLDSLGGAA